MSLLTLLGAVLILLGVLGLFGVIGTGIVVEILLIVAGIACIVYANGSYSRRI